LKTESSPSHCQINTKLVPHFGPVLVVLPTHFYIHFGGGGGGVCLEIGFVLRHGGMGFFK